MSRFQTHQGHLYRVYVGGKLVEFNGGVAVVDDATAAKLRADPLCGREYFEVKPAELEAAKAVTTDTEAEAKAAAEAEAETRARAEAEAKAQAEADAKAKAEADEKAKHSKKNGK